MNSGTKLSNYPVEFDLLSNSRMALFGNILLSFFVIYSFWTHSLMICVFMAINILNCCVRFFFNASWESFERKNKLRLWNLIFNSLVCLTGLTWGLSSITSIRQLGLTNTQTIEILLCLCAVVAASSVYLGSRSSLSRLFMLMLLTPTIVGFPYDQNKPDELFLPFFFIVYFLFHLKISRNDEEKFIQHNQQKVFLQNIINSIPLSITARSFDRERKFSLINPSAEKLWGLSPSDIGKNPEQLFPAEIAMIFQTQDSLAREYKEPVKFPDTTFKLNKESRVISKTLIYLKESKLILDIAEDQTEMKNAQKEIQSLQNYNVQTAKMATLGEMAGGVAHEINNPLAIIMGKSEQIKSELRKEQTNTKLIEQSTDKIILTTKRISKIVQGLLSFSRTGEKDPIVQISIQTLLNEALIMIKEKFELANIHLKILPFDDQTIECQNIPVVQVVLNLLNNSFDAIVDMPDKWVEISVQDLDQDIGIIITDSGSGIRDPEIKEKLMRPFFTTKETGKGVGLGLSLCKGVAEEHGGEFYLNDDCENTQFVLILPKKQIASLVKTA